MAKKYDIVETSLLSGEFDGSAIDVQKKSNEDILENGRLVVVDEANGTVSYPTDDTQPVVLHASVEKLYDTSLGLTEFCKLKDEKVRTYQLELGRIFGTTAIQTGGTNERATYSDIHIGDSVGVGTDGKIRVFDDPANNTSKFKGVVVKKMVLGFDLIPAIRVKVTAI